jgi:hypothetical protein
MDYWVRQLSHMFFRPVLYGRYILSGLSRRLLVISRFAQLLDVSWR